MTPPTLEVQDQRWRIRGDLTFATAAALYARMREIDAWPRILDLTQVGRCDSGGLALVVECLERVESAGRDIRVTGVPEQLGRLAALCDIESLEREQSV